MEEGCPLRIEAFTVVLLLDSIDAPTHYVGNALFAFNKSPLLINFRVLRH